MSSQNATITNSVIQRNGRGGVETRGDVHIGDSTIANNFGAGVRIHDGADVAITRSTISGTQPYDPIMGSPQPLGAGILAYDDTAVSVESSTIWDNTGQGVLSVGALLNIGNSTIGGTRAGEGPTEYRAAVAAASGSIYLAGTIVAGSEGVPACVGDIADAGYNLATDDSCAFDATSFNSVDPNLGALSDNGGPTLTVMPALGPAIDAVPAGELGRDASPFDQRGAGFTRLIGAAGDIGAIEVAQEPVVIAPGTLPAGTVGEEYSVTLSATGGAGEPYAWALVDSALPEGLALSADGVISGIPAEDGTFSITVGVDGVATKDYTLTVAAETVDPDPVDPDPSDPGPVDPDPADPGEGSGTEDAGTLPATGGDDAGTAVTVGALLLLAGGAVFAAARGLRRIRA